MSSAKCNFKWTNNAPLVNVMAKGLRIVADEIISDARRVVPVATGRLRSSIGLQVPPSQEGNRVTATIEATAPYAAYVELGTKNTRPRPYLGPAAEAARRKYGG